MQSLYNNITGANNTALGYAAGDNITTGSSNIIIGSGVDAPSATGSNQLNIGNTIYGDMANGEVFIGANQTNNRRTGGDNSNGDVVIEAPALGDNALTLKAPTSHTNGIGVNIVGMNFAAHNYYNDAGKSGIYYQIMCENGHGTYSDRGQLRFTPGYGGSVASGELSDSIVFTYNGDIEVYGGYSSTGASKGYSVLVENNIIGHKNSASETDTQTHWTFYNPNGAVGTIKTVGSATQFNTSSDYRLKENVVPMTGSIDRVKALKPSRFNFIADPDTTVDGFLAHEAQEVVPEAISGEKDGMTEVGNVIDADDKIIQEDVPQSTQLEDGETWTKTGEVEDYQGIDQSKLVPLLVSAVQELTAKVEALEAQLNA